MTISIRNAPRALKGASYPSFPSWWPNRQVRRAVAQGRDSRLPQAWRDFLRVNPKLRQSILAIR